MKLKGPSRFNSFYEAFSDLIFATMAIFVLLMLIFLMQVTSSEARVESRPLELVVAVDTSGSMGEGLLQLNRTIRTIASVMPEVTDEFRIGIVAYRQRENRRELYEVLPLMLVEPESEDGGASLRRLSNFLDSLEPIAGRAPVVEGVGEALGMMDADRDEDTRQIFMLLGDAGPYETVRLENLNTDLTNDYLTISDQERRNEQQLLEQIADWCNGTDYRNVISVFQRHSMDARWTPAQVTWYTETCPAFFRRVTEAAEQPDNYTDNPGDMLALLLLAILTEDDD